MRLTERHRHHWRRNLRLTAGYEADAHSVRITPRPSGPWKVITVGARPHRIPRPRRAAKPVTTPYGVFRSVQHPGSRGKGTWFRVSDAVAREAPEIVHDEVVKALGRTF